MLRIRTGSRLHFGLFSVGAAPRRFGGAGLMIEEPGVQLCMLPSREWAAEGPSAARVLEFARRFDLSRVLSGDAPAPPLPPQHFLIGHAAPEHVGLGTGTQLGLATARLLAEVCGLPAAAESLALCVERGYRSALGIHGFERGGFLVEAGKLPTDQVSPLVAHTLFPKEWRLLVAIPPHTMGLHGPPEQEAFAQLTELPGAEAQTDTLCRLTLLGLLPALVQQDVQAFGEALYEFNVRVGEMFAPIQGGIYSSKQVEEIVTILRGDGATGVGQSSWGPTVFAVFADTDQAEDAAAKLRTRLPQLTNVFVAAAMNRGAILSSD